MSEKKKLGAVFKTVGLPPYTYIKPSYYGWVKADILQPGKHLLIEGPSGIGKTCVVFKVFEELNWTKSDYVYLSCRDRYTSDEISHFLNMGEIQKPSLPIVMVLDDFHMLPKEKRALIGASLKRMSDHIFERHLTPKMIMIGIPTSGVPLLSDANDLGPRLGTYVLTRATDSEIDRLISEGENALDVIFDDREILFSESGGNFWLTQYVCCKICANHEVFETQSATKILSFDLLGIRKGLMTELSLRYLSIAKTFAKGKSWRPGGNKPYLEVLLALCKIPESVVSFDQVINMVPERRRPAIKAIRSRIAEVIYNPTKGIDLRKQIAFDPSSGFTIEDPLFRYFLSNLESDDLFRELGIEHATVAKGLLYSYDIGFSFAGETRKIVEAINKQMKSEDVITFYDYDQQAFLLALDLEATLGHIYAESCRYYLVFLDRFYREKVWTKYEKDVMTQKGRKNHIIPIVLDDSGTEGAVGIPSTIGRIDLRDVWQEVQRRGTISSETINTLRNRCVLPVLEKLGAETEVT